MRGKKKPMSGMAMLMCACACALALSSCDTVDNRNRIPALPVALNLGNTGLWNTYGVAGFGLHREFIKDEKIPSNFQYTANTYTGFGGVLLIGGMDPFTADTNVPQAYDLSCPVECKATVRVYIDEETFEAVCPECHSHYDVTMAGGAPTAGPALTGKYKYGLQRYRCVAQPLGGYVISR